VIVRARRKPIEEIPEKFICCEKMMGEFVIAQPESRILHVEVPAYEASWTCVHCGRVDFFQTAITKEGAPFCIVVDNYDLDEGVDDDH